MKKYPRGKGGVTLLAEKMLIDVSVLKNALKIEKKSPELILVICERFLTLSEAMVVQKRTDEYTVADGELILEEGLAEYIENMRNDVKDIEKIIALWKSKVSLCELARKEAMKKNR